MKLFLIICIVFLFSGCSVNYNINIERSNPLLCSEELIINEFDSSIVGTTFEEFLNLIYEKVSNTYEINSNGKNRISVKKNTFNLSDLNNSKLLEKYIISSEINDGNINIIFDEEELGNLIRSNEGETIEETGLSININIRVPYKVIETNATKVDGNIYTWSFDKNNEITDIIIKYDSNIKSIKLSSRQLVIISLGAISFLIVAVILIVFIKHKLVNN